MSFSRRTALIGLGGGLVSGCDSLSQSTSFREGLRKAEDANFTIQRSLTDRAALAPEFELSQRSPVFRGNGTIRPASATYQQHLSENFANWRLRVDGLVARPQSLSLAQLQAGPKRTQTTRHDCVEGWSAIGTWTGTPLKLLLDQAGILPKARFVVLHCADLMEGGRPYYESIDLVDAFHPQTILAWGLNGRPLPVANGAPLRLRVERQLGYKQAKYVQHIEVTDQLTGIFGGRGGYWEDVADYEWYAGL